MATAGFAVMRCDYRGGVDGPHARFTVHQMVRTLDDAQVEANRLNDAERRADVYYFWKAAHAFER
jgi:hypothetical protein